MGKVIIKIFILKLLQLIQKKHASDTYVSKFQFRNICLNNKKKSKDMDIIKLFNKGWKLQEDFLNNLIQMAQVIQMKMRFQK